MRAKETERRAREQGEREQETREGRDGGRVKTCADSSKRQYATFAGARKLQLPNLGGKEH